MPARRMLGPKENAWSRVHATLQTLFPLLKDYSWANDDLDLERELAFASKRPPRATSTRRPRSWPCRSSPASAPRPPVTWSSPAGECASEALRGPRRP